MEETLFNEPSYFDNAPKHLRKQYNQMVTKAFKKAIRNGLDMRIEKYPPRTRD